MDILSIVLALLVFSLLVIGHELGHFALAKWSKVQVNEFWLGMGPTLLQKEFKGTVYKLKALPFGGAVVMEGEDGNYTNNLTEAITGQKSFGEAPILNRILILLAGSFMNFVLGFVIVLIVGMSTDFQTTTIADFSDEFIYESENGLLPNDTFIEIDGMEINTVSDISTALNANETQIYDFTLLRDENEVILEDFELKPYEYVDESGNSQFRFGIELATKRANFSESVEYAFRSCVSFVEIVWMSLGMLVTGEVGIQDLGGPVVMASMIGQAAEQSMSQMWTFAALISVNLGVMNLLPLPALDGGRVIFLIIEAIRKKPIDPKVEGIIHGVGLLILFGFMIVVTFHDLFVKIPGA